MRSIVAMSMLTLIFAYPSLLFASSKAICKKGNDTQIYYCCDDEEVEGLRLLWFNSKVDGKSKSHSTVCQLNDGTISSKCTENTEVIIPTGTELFPTEQGYACSMK